MALPGTTVISRQEHASVQMSAVALCPRRQTPALDTGFEGQLVDYCTQTQNRLFSMTQKDLRSMAYQIAERNDIEHNFNREKKMACTGWAAGFLLCCPQLSPKPTSIGRAIGFNPVEVAQFCLSA